MIYTGLICVSVIKQTRLSLFRRTKHLIQTKTNKRTSGASDVYYSIVEDLMQHYQWVGDLNKVTIFTVPLGVSISIIRMCLIRAALSWCIMDTFISRTAQNVGAWVLKWSSCFCHSFGNFRNCVFASLVWLNRFFQSFAARFGDRLIRGLYAGNFRQHEEKED